MSVTFYPGPVTVRAIVSKLLVCLLLACPYLCRAVEGGCSHELTTAADDPDDDSHIPPSCPNDGVCCICAGATQTGEFRAGDLASPGFLACVDGWSFPLAVVPLSSATRYPALEKPPAGLAVFGDGLAVRAFLQNFRF
jgi:hypothetical protein